jgi:hypothetical protein
MHCRVELSPSLSNPCIVEWIFRLSVSVESESTAAEATPIDILHPRFYGEGCRVVYCVSFVIIEVDVHFRVLEEHELWPNYKSPLTK